MNDQFERELRAALTRRDPAPDFAERVLAQLPGRPVLVRKRPVYGWRIGAIAAAVALLAFSAVQYREYRRALDAKQQLMFALQLTAHKLHVAHEKVNQRNQQP